MQRITELSGSQLGTFQIISVGFINHNTVRHLHNATLDTLQFISCSCQLNQQEEIDHRMDNCLALSHSHGLHKDFIESGRLAKNNRFTRLTCYSSQ